VKPLGPVLAAIAPIMTSFISLTPLAFDECYSTTMLRSINSAQSCLLYPILCTVVTSSLRGCKYATRLNRAKERLISGILWEDFGLKYMAEI
jgi:hypothetical protein